MSSAGENSESYSVKHKLIFTNSAFYFFLSKVGFVKIRRLPKYTLTFDYAKTPALLIYFVVPRTFSQVF